MEQPHNPVYGEDAPILTHPHKQKRCPTWHLFLFMYGMEDLLLVQALINDNAECFFGHSVVDFLLLLLREGFNEGVEIFIHAQFGQFIDCFA